MKIFGILQELNNKQMKILHQYFILFLLFHACTSPPKPLSSVNLSKIDETDMFNDTTFFSRIMSMNSIDNRIFLSDYQRNQILEIAPMDTIISTIGNQGRGPGELLGVSSLFVKNDTVYVVNEFHQCFDIFNKSGHIRSYKPNMPIGRGFRFSVVGENIIYSSLTKEHSMAFCNIKNDSVVYFGNVFSLESMYSGRHIWTNENYIYSVSETRPIIERYLLTGAFVDQLDYGNIEQVKKIIQHAENNPTAENVFYILIEDVYLTENSLYLLITSYNGKQTFCNPILRIDITKMEPVNLYTLTKKDSWFTSFCVNGNDLFAFNPVNACIEKYQLP